MNHTDTCNAEAIRISQGKTAYTLAYYYNTAGEECLGVWLWGAVVQWQKH